MVTIPASLQPPTRAKTVAQLRKPQLRATSPQPTTQVQTIEQKNKLIQESIATYKEKLERQVASYKESIKRYKERGDTERVNKYKDRLEVQRAYYEGIITALEQSKGSQASFSAIQDYAKDFGRYSKRRMENKYAQRPELTQTSTETKPTTISYETPASQPSQIKPGQPLYYELGETGKPVGDVAYTSPDKTGRKITEKELRPKLKITETEQTPDVMYGSEIKKLGWGDYIEREPIQRGLNIPTQEDTRFLREQEYRSIPAPQIITMPKEIRSRAETTVAEDIKDALVGFKNIAEVAQPKTETFVIGDTTYSTNIQQEYGTPSYYTGLDIAPDKKVVLRKGELPEPDTFAQNLIGGAMIAGGVIKGGGILYKDVVVPVVAKGKTIQRLGKYVIQPTIKYGVIPAYEGVASGLGYVQEKVIRPISEKGIPIPQKTVPGVVYKILTGGETRTAPLGYQQGDKLYANPVAAIAESARYTAELSKIDPEATVTIGLGSQQREIPAGELSGGGILGFGGKIITSQVETGFTDFSKDYSREILGREVSQKTAERIGKGAALVTEYSPYLIPGYYEGTIIAQATESQLLGGEYGAPSTAVGFIKENPLETTLVVGLQYGRAVSKLGKAWSASDAAKYAKYLQQPESVQYRIDEVAKEQIIKRDIFKRKIKAIAAGEKTKRFAELGGRIKTIDTQKALQLQGDWSGRIVEYVKVDGKTKRLTADIFIKTYDSGRIVRTITYDNTGVVKVITTKGTVGTVEVSTKTGKLLVKSNFNAADLSDELLKIGKSQVAKGKIDWDEPGKYILETRKVKVGKKTVTALQIKDKTGEIVLAVDSKSKVGRQIINSKWGEQVAKKVTGTYQGTVSTYQSKDFLRGQVVGERESFTRGLVASERSGKTSASRLTKKVAEKEGVVFSKRIGTRIEVGIDKTLDISLVGQNKKLAFITGVRQPTSISLTSQKYARTIRGYELAPGSKKVASQKAALKLKEEAIAKAFEKASKAKKAKFLKDLQVELTRAKIKGWTDEAISIDKKIEKFSAMIRQGQAKAKVAAGSGQSIYSGGSGGQTFSLGDEQALAQAQSGPLSLGQFTTSDVVRIQRPTIFQEALKTGAKIDERIVPLFGTLTQKSTAIVLPQTLGAFSLLSEIDVKQDISPDIKVDTRAMQEEVSVQDIDVTQDVDVSQDVDVIQEIDERSRSRSEQLIEQRIDQTAVEPVTEIYERPINPIGNIRERIPGPRESLRPIVLDIDFGGRKTLSKPVQAYHGEVMSGGKFKRVTEKPHSKKGALDVISRIIDNTTSAQGRVVKTKKKVSSDKLARGDGYYSQNKKKFRDFKIFKGRPTPMKDKIIERKEFRSDSPGEKSGLTVAQFTSRARKRAAGLPVRKRKTPFRL